MKRKRDKAAGNVHTAPVICLCFSFHRSVSITGISSGWDKIGKKVNTINYLILFVVIDIHLISLTNRTKMKHIRRNIRRQNINSVILSIMYR